MLMADELLQTMRAALADEREGIIRFDAAVVGRANDAKQTVLKRLHETPAAERGPLLAALDQLKPALRCNLILLTHARACLREAREDDEAAVKASNGVVPLFLRKTA